ncbi:hypothetical protein B0H15DRAFT_815546 [Mycena belliarum]|uniref:Uncharacterized protein n=1 Tax=Mycena belliarum TaxID=1033014 RepID=A0AAD6UF12_9AGAR|nr:hypothetical protein B0H15DRAFT_815546 [Mycena belliae]
MSICSLDTSLTALPAYTPSAAVPSYSPEPGHDERLIERAPYSKSRAPTGIFIQKSGRDTVVLFGQEENAEVPTYRRNGTITGFVSIEDRDGVTKVLLTIKGKIEVLIPGGGFVTKTIVDEHRTLWSSENSGAPCPGDVPFSSVLPTTFIHEDRTYPLPPSYNASLISIGGADVKVHYALSIVIFRKRKLSFLSAKNTTSVRFNYAPRTRPARPIHPILTDFLSDIKVAPEEWRQSTTLLAPRATASVAPVHLSFFTPAAEIFALGDTVPFHVQLTGPAASLRAFLPPAPGAGGQAIQVSLVRQLIAGAGAGASVRFTTAHATLASAPPGASADAHASLDWTGALVCPSDIQVGTFDAGVLKAQDFVVVDVAPQGGAAAPFARARHAHPVRLVSDPWPDT